jgi:regulator of protease activity HflC (stomatin/prohibitin superfamily)
MSTVIKSDARITSIRVTDETITADLADGRTVSVPLAWSWRLSDAAPEQRGNWRIIGSGQGVHWPDVDEDISIRGMLDGIPAARPGLHPA